MLTARREGATHLVLSDGRLTDSTTVTVAGAEVFRPFTSIRIGGAHACAIDTDRALWCWGGSWSGELGTGERLRLAHHLTPQRVALPEPITDVAVGSQHTCALGASGGVFCAGLTSLGRAYCWGNNRNGVLGDGVRRRTVASITTAFSPLPVPVR